MFAIIFMRIIFKGIVHPKMKILSSLTLISFPTSMDILSLAENKIRFNIHRTLDTDDYFFLFRISHRPCWTLEGVPLSRWTQSSWNSCWLRKRSWPRSLPSRGSGTSKHFRWAKSALCLGQPTLCHRTTVPVLSPHTSCRWRGERVIDPPPIERTCPDFHFTTDYILYNWVCDE